MRIAIVGSEGKYWDYNSRTKAVRKIREIFYKHVPMDFNHMLFNELTLVSGGCPKGGVDIFAECVADTLLMRKLIFEPDHNSWEGKKGKRGYKQRNIQIAEECDILYCIDPKERDWSGGRWTMNYAEKLGKETHLILL